MSEMRVWKGSGPVVGVRGEGLPSGVYGPGSLLLARLDPSRPALPVLLLHHAPSTPSLPNNVPVQPVLPDSDPSLPVPQLIAPSQLAPFSPEHLSDEQQAMEEVHAALGLLEADPKLNEPFDIEKPVLFGLKCHAGFSGMARKLSSGEIEILEIGQLARFADNPNRILRLERFSEDEDAQFAWGKCLILSDAKPSLGGFDRVSVTNLGELVFDDSLEKLFGSAPNGSAVTSSPKASANDGNSSFVESSTLGEGSSSSGKKGECLSQKRPPSGKECSLCGKVSWIKTDVRTCGPLVGFIKPARKNHSLTWVHVLCARYTSGVFMGGENCNVVQRINQCANLKCAAKRCNKKGASVGCFHSSHRTGFHFPCVRETKWEPCSSKGHELPPVQFNPLSLPSDPSSHVFASTGRSENFQFGWVVSFDEENLWCLWDDEEDYESFSLDDSSLKMLFESDGKVLTIDDSNPIELVCGKRIAKSRTKSKVPKHVALTPSKEQGPVVPVSSQETSRKRSSSEIETGPNRSARKSTGKSLISPAKVQKVSHPTEEVVGSKVSASPRTIATSTSSRPAVASTPLTSISRATEKDSSPLPISQTIEAAPPSAGNNVAAQDAALSSSDSVRTKSSARRQSAESSSGYYSGPATSVQKEKPKSTYFQDWVEAVKKTRREELLASKQQKLNIADEGVTSANKDSISALTGEGVKSTSTVASSESSKISAPSPPMNPDILHYFSGPSRPVKPKLPPLQAPASSGFMFCHFKDMPAHQLSACLEFVEQKISSTCHELEVLLQEKTAIAKEIQRLTAEKQTKAPNATDGMTSEKAKVVTDFVSMFYRGSS